MIPPTLWLYTKYLLVALLLLTGTATLLALVSYRIYLCAGGICACCLTGREEIARMEAELGGRRGGDGNEDGDEDEDGDGEKRGLLPSQEDKEEEEEAVRREMGEGVKCEYENAGCRGYGTLSV